MTKNIDNKKSTINFLKNQKLINPYRIKSLIQEAIHNNNLDLTDFTIFTEAATMNYVVTPIIAAMAGGKVFAITKDSQYGTAIEIKEFTNKFADFCGVKDKIKVVFEKKKEIIKKANIVTNLGFVRPIDKSFVNMMNEKAVIPYMYEAWEFREEDINLNACKLKNIPVMATNESIPGIEIIDFIGPLCLKMLFELEIEVHKSKILIVSRDRFGNIIEKYLKLLGANIYLIEDLKTEKNLKYLKDCEALVVADLKSNETFIGRSGQISAKELIEISRKISVIQFAGDIEIDELEEYDIPFFPKRRIGKYRMGMTLAYIGPKPIIDLHCAGLKVGEVMARARMNGKNLAEIESIALKNSPAQILK